MLNPKIKKWTEEDRFLGMDHPITRRDFLQGIAVSVASLAIGCNHDKSGRTNSYSNAFPFELTGLRGQDIASMQLGHRVRYGDFRDLPNNIVDTNEEFDLIVIGAGLAGLTAAYIYHREMKGRCRILLLDNHDDFGGHARRNTFHYEGTTLIAHGGTYALEEPENSPSEVSEILTELGIDSDRMVEFRDPEFKKRLGLSSGVFFDPKIYSNISPTWVTRFYDIPHEEFFAKAPIPDAARKELVEFYTTRRDYLPGVLNKEEVLAKMSWEAFIRQKMELGDEAVRFANLYATDLIGLGCDAVSALAGYEVGPGFYGMGGPGFHEENGILKYAYDPMARFPDGNHTIARCLLRAIMPEVMPGANTMEEVFNSHVNYAEFDQPNHNVRLRLRSMALRIEHKGPISTASSVDVYYVQPNGQVFHVRAKSVVVAAWGMVAKHIIPELSHLQLKALDQYRYTSALYINVLLRHWRPIAQLGLYEMYLPGGFCTWMHISDPLYLGHYRPEYHPDKPTILSFYKYIHQPGIDPDEQMTLGRIEMENTPFEVYERQIREELYYLFGSWGFDPANDIVAITINRWGHGYNFFKKPGAYYKKGEAPYEFGRMRLGRISFAGADAGGSPWSQLAMQQGRRAALEQL
jgi:spermidine dehydrogenase